MRIHVYPDPILLRPGKTISAVTKEVREKVREMIEFMFRAKGVGLAAHQVGWSRMVTVFDADPEKGKEQVLINPEILKREGTVEKEEGCLSFPGIYGIVRRAPRVLVRGMDLSGKEIRIEAEGLLAQVLQHEIDHLNGVLFTTKMTPATRIQVQKQLKLLEEQFKKMPRD